MEQGEFLAHLSYGVLNHMELPLEAWCAGPEQQRGMLVGYLGDFPTGVVHSPAHGFALLQLFIGFGFPYEGPAPLEAIANGCVFLQARFNPPHSSLNHEFFRGKPTSREASLA